MAIQRHEQEKQRTHVEKAETLYTGSLRTASAARGIKTERRSYPCPKSYRCARRALRTCMLAMSEAIMLGGDRHVMGVLFIPLKAIHKSWVSQLKIATTLGTYRSPRLTLTLLD